jgi:Family of unknown function (DUF6535)
MHESDIFPRTGRDAPSRFWSAYERVAKQHDDEFIERHSGDMDVLLIFVCATVILCVELNSIKYIIRLVYSRLSARLS